MKTGKLQIWVPELIAREGGIQSYSIEIVEAAVEILGPGRVTVLSKSDNPKALRERFGGKVKTYATGNIPGRISFHFSSKPLPEGLGIIGFAQHGDPPGPQDLHRRFHYLDGVTLNPPLPGDQLRNPDLQLSSFHGRGS